MKAVGYSGDPPARDDGERLEECRRRFERGQRGALLDAFACCARSGMPMPKWLADEWMRTYSGILTGRVNDLNEALGFNVRDPRTRNRIYIIATRAADVGNAVLRERRSGRPLDDELKQTVADQLGLTLRQVRDCWDACRAEFEPFGLEIDDLDPDPFFGLMQAAPKARD